MNPIDAVDKAIGAARGEFVVGHVVKEAFEIIRRGDTFEEEEEIDRVAVRAERQKFMAELAMLKE